LASSRDEPFGLLVFDPNQRVPTKLGPQEDGSSILALIDGRGGLAPADLEG